MNQYLKLKKSNCRNCYKCIRNCPVKSIKFSDNQAHIVEDECILCGQCFVVCPQNAKEVRNDVARAKALLASGAPVVASIAPSFVANFPGVTIASLRDALGRLGFAGAEETAVGATIVSRQYEQLVHARQQRVILSSCCHTVNLLIQKYYPGALPYLAAVLSPMQAHCQDIKRRVAGAKTVFIGPCISKKAEADQYEGYVDCALTFEEFSEWLEAEGIALASGAPEPPSEGGRARLYPTAGGILRSMDREEGFAYLAVDGVDNCIQAVRDVIEGNLTDCFIEMSACPGSCVGGPAMQRGRTAPVRDFLAVDRYAKSGDFPTETYTSEELKKPFSFLGVHQQHPGQQAIEEVLRKMGKTSPEKELNCGSCGYNTCREKAAAVCMGKADPSMCLPFLMEKAESFSDTIISNTPNAIIVLNEALEVQQINNAACRLMNIQTPRDVLEEQVVRILDPQPFLEVLSTGRSIRDRRVYLAEYGRSVEQSILYDKSYHILMSIMRDVTDEEEARNHKEALQRQTVEITDKVIEKQMRAVQEIASLLGETTAETKVALTKLKESLRDE